MHGVQRVHSDHSEVYEELENNAYKNNTGDNDFARAYDGFTAVLSSNKHMIGVRRATVLCITGRLHWISALLWL